MKRPSLGATLFAHLLLALPVGAQDFDGDGLADGVDACPGSMSMMAPTRWVAGKTFTFRVNELDGAGEIDWRKFQDQGVVSATRVSDGADVPISIVIFDTHDGTPAPDSVRFYNGAASVSIILDDGAAHPSEDIFVRVAVGGVSVSKVVSVLNSPAERAVSGVLTGDDLNWSAADGVIHVTASVSIPDGATLNIGPGTLVMVDAGAPNDGTAISVTGRLLVNGSPQNPVFFFPTAGAPALHLTALCTEDRFNQFAWRGFLVEGSQHSVLESAIVTGAGNSDRVGHARGPIIYAVNLASLTMNNCVVSDNNGKLYYGVGRGTYTVTNSLVTRCGYGAEFGGSGYYSVLFEDTWLTSIGQGPPGCERDGDFFDFRAATPGLGGPNVVRRCFMADGNDDGCDQDGGTFTLESCVMWDVRDKAISLTSGSGGGVTIDNCLVFGTGTGVKPNGLPCTVLHSTIASPSPVYGVTCANTTIKESVIWSGSISTCCGVVQHNLVGAGSGACGLGNFTANPLFVNPAAFNYDLQTGSPALIAGPTGGRIGWTPPPPAPFDDCVPDNDACEGAQPVSEGTLVFDTSSAAENGPVGECTKTDGIVHKDLWYLYTAPADGFLDVFVSDAGFVDRIVVYDGSSCAGIPASEIVCGEGTSAEATVRAPVQQGAEYLIQVGGLDVSSFGPGMLNVAYAPPPPPRPIFLMSFLSTAVVPGVGTVQNEDVVAYDSGTGVWSMVIDGSDLGLTALTIDAVALTLDGDFLLSFTTDANVAAMTGGPNGALLDDSDLVRFSPGSLGAVTAGSLEFYFDGSDVGLDETNNSEDSDAVSVLPDGSIVFGFIGTTTVPGVTSAQDEDLVRFVPSALGAATAGTWSWYFDGSDVGLSTTADEDTDAVGIGPGGELIFSTLGAFAVPGVSGSGSDAFAFSAATVGATTSGTYSPALSLVSLGIDPSENLSSLEAVLAVPQPAMAAPGAGTAGTLSEFLDRFFAADPAADLDRNSTVDQRDLGEFLGRMAN